MSIGGPSVAISLLIEYSHMYITERVTQIVGFLKVFIAYSVSLHNACITRRFDGFN
jgi:hypothetical protein